MIIPIKFIALGKRMLNKCPKWKSCGAYRPIWTDESMPDSVGQLVTIKAFRVYKDDCKSKAYRLQVIRCSLTDHDYIYRYLGGYYDKCPYAFCGTFG